MAENEINKVQVLIRRFLFEVDGIIHDPSACQAWLQSFCKTLQFQDLCKEPNQYALFLLDEARAFNIEQRRKSQMKQVRRALAEDGIKNPTQEQLDEKWLEMYGNETTADASEGDGEVNPDGQQATQAESATSANNSGNGGSGTSQARQSRRTGGGSVKQGQCSIVSPVRSIPMPTKEQLYDFARTEGLDETDARDWFEMTVVERDGNDRNGKPITNWKAACKKFCTVRQNRRTA